MRGSESGLAKAKSAKEIVLHGQVQKARGQKAKAEANHLRHRFVKRISVVMSSECFVCSRQKKDHHGGDRLGKSGLHRKET